MHTSPYRQATQKIVRQPAACTISPPALGASIGTTLMMSWMSETIRAASSPLIATSRMMARGITSPAAPPSAARARNTISSVMPVASAQPADAST